MDPFALQQLVWASLSPLSSPSVLRGLHGLDSVPEVHPLCRSLVSTCLSFRGTYSALPGFCALVSALRAGPCVTGLVWNCFGSLCLPSASWVLCVLILPHLHSFAGVIWSFSCPRRVVCATQVCMPPLYQHPSPSLCDSCLPCHTRLPGPALCAARVVRAGWVCLLRYTQLGLYATPRGGLGSSVSPGGCFVEVVPYLDEFFMYLGGGWRSPHCNSSAIFFHLLWSCDFFILYYANMFSH